MLSGFTDKVAVVTGAARPRSIGRATALRLAAEGAKVACLDIARPYDDFPEYAVANADDLDEIVAQLRDVGSEAIAVRADVSDETQVDAAIAEVVDRLGPVDLLANVAGGSGAGMGAAPLLDLTPLEFQRVLDVNLVGTWLVSRACARTMIAAGTGGRIVNTSSQAGKVGWPMIGAYSAAKAGVISITQVMAQEWAEHGILVNAVCPGTVDTDLVNPNNFFVDIMDAMESGGFDAWMGREIPIGRLQRADEVASVIAFLMSDDASYITGEAVNVSGGQMMA
jgi:NAD(P)-dependent dehydrogenase (short-subunit alcohol dehydrogenase family)